MKAGAVGQRALFFCGTVESAVRVSLSLRRTVIFRGSDGTRSGRTPHEVPSPHRTRSLIIFISFRGYFISHSHIKRSQRFAIGIFLSTASAG